MIFKYKHIRFILGWCALILFTQCSDSSDDTTVDQDAIDQATIEEFLTENEIVAIADGSGIHYSIIDTVLTGAPAAGSILSIYYSARILNGSAYDENTRSNSNDSVKLKQGVGAVYPVGLDVGLGLMREGETFKFYIPSSLAYGDYSFSSLIPENSILEIEIELAAVQNEADILSEQLTAIDAYILDEALNNTTINPLDSIEYLAAEQIYYKRMVAGTADDTLRQNDFATISYIGTNLLKEEFDRRPSAEPLTYTFGANAIIVGLDDGVSAMERGETALIILPSHKAYGESAFVIPSYRKQDFVDLEIIPQYAAKVAPYEVLIFETSLLNNP
ncbi:MAG: FKBP-type peptidyl-prolyl cis-trans isomerase [Reichenbachiella sp.]|uniref:FKBP-type peptidyl-prolyl cis-trans isomerase n=1 Tax=Reichenbachiella sp. TaxID=2184521 RepID=UPI00326344FB